MVAIVAIIITYCLVKILTERELSREQIVKDDFLKWGRGNGTEKLQLEKSTLK